MNTRNILVHQCITTHHPHLIETYEFFDDCDTFEPSKLECAVDNDDHTKNESTYGKRTNVVTYHTLYID